MTTHMETAIPLHTLKQRPFELLREMERRGLQAASGSAGAGDEEWVGLAFRLGEENFVASRHDVREVMVFPDACTRIPGSKDWVKGLANVRGQLMPVIDFRAFLGGGTTRPGRDTRLVVVNHRDVPAGLIVDEVFGFRRFAPEQRVAESPETVLRCERYLQGAYRQDMDAWPLFDLTRLVESPQFLQAGQNEN
ncbi:MAG: chemotaxis protein CheW [Gammaproteobacteria bacterium]